LRARLVIGADGAQSRVRELAGLFATRADYGQVAIVAMVQTARPHAGTAWQRFLGDGTLAFLPLADGHSSIVWSLPTARAESLLTAPIAQFERELQKDFDSALGAVRLVSERLKFPLWKLSADQYVMARIALVGDAAHVVHPLAGQGANLGLLDAAALADVLAAGLAQREDPGAVRILRRYERWRRSENELMAAAIDVFGRLLARSDGRLAGLAQRGMPWVGRSAAAKRLFIERAMGLAGEMPSAARR
jgi:2-octaprenylphenol hydroxylase